MADVLPSQATSSAIEALPSPAVIAVDRGASSLACRGFPLGWPMGDRHAAFSRALRRREDGGRASREAAAQH
jgi:hypothetical protein